MKLLFKGPVTTASGYGVHARQILKALIASNAFDISVRCLNWGNTSFLLQSTPFYDKIMELTAKYNEEHARGQNNYDISIQVTIPNEFEKLANINVGVTAGIEVDHVSHEWLTKCNDVVDLLYVPSKHSLKAFEATGYKGQDGNILSLNKRPVLAHEGFNPRYYNTEPIEDNPFDFDTEFNFLFVGLGINGKYGEERKNISNLVKWFCEAFAGRQDVGLVLKTAVVNNSLMDFENTKSLIERIKKDADVGQFPKIHLVHGRLSDEEMAALYKHDKIKAFVSLTHGEGFGLPLLEAAACGLPVITTNWSGHLDFLTMNTSKGFVKLDYELKPVPESAVWPGVIENGTKWAVVNEEDVKLKLRKVEASYEKPKEWATKLSKHIHENFTEGKVMSKFVEDLLLRLKNVSTKRDLTPDDFAKQVRDSLPHKDEKVLLYTMPMSAGDVYISTAVVDGLKKKYPDHRVYFATSEQYAGILKDNPNVDEVIPYQQWMSDINICEKIFDEVYTPNLAVQMSFSNWVHGGKGRKLAKELAVNCNVELGDYWIKLEEPSVELPEKYVVLNPGSGKGQWEARNYIHWQEIVNNLKRELSERDIEIVQTGLPDDPLYDGCVDLRGKTKSINELAYVIDRSELVLGIDSVTMHLAAGHGVDHVALFGSSYAGSTGPVQLGKKSTSMLMETPSRYTCDKACYKYQCSVDREVPCINEIDPKVVWSRVLHVLGIPVGDADGMVKLSSYEEYNPKISGYTHVFNAESGGYPYVQSIRSMLGFCDEVVVVDGGSDDGTLEKIKAIDDDRIKVFDREWDWEEPGMDGMQKAFGRAMCTGEFLWQQDVDEVVHEDDYEKIRKLVKRFPKSVDLLHLPVVELWADGQTVRTDRHSWKWRLSRNDFRITHGINKQARVIDEETGKVYAKRGMSDGCEYIDIMTNEYIPHAGFYSQELENLRRTNPQEYGKKMNELFNELPSVYHYSWANIPRKVKNFKQFWDKCWSNLYREQAPEDRFPEVEGPDDEEGIAKVSAKLKDQGGEHQKAPTFKLEHTNPAVMKEWLDAIS